MIDARHLTNKPHPYHLTRTNRNQKLMSVKADSKNLLADLYQVETKVLNQAVKRNIERFPDTFMFRLSNEEYNFIR